MATHTTQGTDYSTFPESDGEPMAETVAHMLQMVDLQVALHALFARQGRPAVAVGGNQLMYYNPHSGWDHISPDVYVSFALQGYLPPSWRTWEHGGLFPEIVFEITSPSTWQVDVGPGPRQKPALYGRLGVREYYVYDPLGEVIPRFQGWERRGDTWVALLPGAEGGIWSALLGAELRPEPLGATVWREAGTWLRVIDPHSGEPIPLAEEEQAARIAAEERAQGEAQARLAAEERAREAEERARRAEAALLALLAEREGAAGTSEAPTDT